MTKRYWKPTTASEAVCTLIGSMATEVWMHQFTLPRVITTSMSAPCASFVYYSWIAIYFRLVPIDSTLSFRNGEASAKYEYQGSLDFYCDFPRLKTQVALKKKMSEEAPVPDGLRVRVDNLYTGDR